MDSEAVELRVAAQRHLPGDVSRLRVHRRQQPPGRLLAWPMFFGIPESGATAVPAEVTQLLRVDEHVSEFGIERDTRPEPATQRRREYDRSGFFAERRIESAIVGPAVRIHLFLTILLMLGRDLGDLVRTETVARKRRRLHRNRLRGPRLLAFCEPILRNRTLFNSVHGFSSDAVEDEQ